MHPFNNHLKPHYTEEFSHTHLPIFTQQYMEELLSFRMSLMSYSVLLCILFLGVSTATNISDDALEFDSSHGYTSISRSLLQLTKRCPLHLEFLNYSIVTDQCIGPRYPPDKCCTALKQLGCPIAAELNDLTTNCAAKMFDYIKLHGDYPEGLFASECHEGKEGLSCNNFTSPSTDADFNVSTAPFSCCPFMLLLSLITGSIILMFLM